MDNKNNKRNRRKIIRAKIDINVSYAILSSATITKSINNNQYSSLWINCDVYDISHAGIALKFKQVILKGEAIKIKLENSSDKYIYDAVVMNINGQRIGIKFINLNISQVNFIKNNIYDYLIGKKKILSSGNNDKAFNFASSNKLFSIFI